jgi:hypothetical protein
MVGGAGQPRRSQLIFRALRWSSTVASTKQSGQSVRFRTFACGTEKSLFGY